MSKLTKLEVLVAVDRAISPWSNYIGDQVHRAHKARVESGGVGHSPTAALILRRLNELASDGMLLKSKFTQGYYGYRWDITPAGRSLLSPKGGKE